MHRKIDLQELIESKYDIDEIISYRFLKNSKVIKRNLIEYTSPVFKGTKFSKTAVSLEMFLLMSIFENKNTKEIIDPFLVIDFFVKHRSEQFFCIEDLHSAFSKENLDIVIDFFINSLNKINLKSYKDLLDTLSKKEILFERYKNNFFLNPSEYHEGQISTFFYQLKRILEFSENFNEARFVKIISLDIKDKKDQNLFNFFVNLR